MGISGQNANDKTPTPKTPIQKMLAIKEKELKENVAKEYKRRFKFILESKLNGGNAVRAINTWAVAVLRYTGGILEWNKEELQNMDRKTRKIMTMNGALQPRASVATLY